MDNTSFQSANLRKNQRSDNSRLYDELYSLTQGVVIAALEDAAMFAKDPDFRALPGGSNLYERLDALDALHKDITTIREDLLADLKQLFYQHASTDHDVIANLLAQPDMRACDATQVKNAIQESIDNSRESHRDILLNIELRLQALSEASSRHVNYFCMHPESLYAPFLHSLEIIPLSANSKILLCNLYHKTLSCKLSAFYQKADELLLSDGLLDSSEKIDEALRERDTGIPVLTNAQDATSMDCMSTGEFFLPVDTQAWLQPDDHRPKVFETEETLPDLVANELTDTDPTEQLIQGFFFAPQDSELDDLLEPYAPGSGSSSSPHQRDQVIFALSHVQRAVIGKEECLNADQIKDSLRQFLYKSGSFDANKIIENEAGVFEFVNSVFEQILNDNCLQNFIRNLLGKLHIPVIKLAIIDFAFFRNPAHPARLLLNSLTSISIGIQDRQDPLYARLSELVNQILNEFEADPATFEQVLGQIRNIEHTVTEQAHRVEAGTRKKAKIKSRRSAARKSVIKVINHYLKDKTLPEEVLDFCFNCWAPHMGLIYLYQGTRSYAWISAVKSLRKIIEVAKPGRSLLEIEHITDGADSFFDTLRSQLDQVSDLARSRGSIFNRAENWYMQLLAEQIRLNQHYFELETKTTAAPDDEDKHDESPSETVVQFLSDIQGPSNESHDVRDEMRDLVQAIPPEVIPGAWFEIYRGEDRNKRRLKLSAILKDTGRLLFADRSGVAALEMDIETFLDDMQKGRTQIIDESNRFDNALSSVISSIRDNQHKLASALK